MTVRTIKMTARQFLGLGEDPPGVRLELGECHDEPAPGWLALIGAISRLASAAIPTMIESYDGADG